MAHIEIIVGTVLGASEYVADALKEILENSGHQATIHLHPDIDDIPKNHVWLVCTSTHGAGDLPDNIQPFADSLTAQDLSDVKSLIVGLGDSSYDTFCQGAQQMEDKLQQQGATLLAPTLQIDVLNHPIPEDKAVEWLGETLQHIAL